MITIVMAKVTPHQRIHTGALSKGLQAHGIDSKKIIYGGRIKTKYVACWGWRIGKTLRKLGHEVLVMERGYIGDRFAYTSLGWNGLNGHAEFPEYDYTDDRFKKHGITLKPWKKDGDYALILGQVPKDQSLQGRDMLPWYYEMSENIKRKYDIPVHFRPHPDLRRKGIRQVVDGTIKSQGTLDESLSGAKFTVCFNSNSSVDSVINGVPCIVGDKGSMAYEMCSTSIDELIYTEREDWVSRLAYTQWTIDEISSGYALGEICKRMQS